MVLLERVSPHFDGTVFTGTDPQPRGSWGIQHMYERIDGEGLLVCLVELLEQLAW